MCKQANSGVPDQTLRFMESDLDLHFLPMFHKKDSRLIWVKKLDLYKEHTIHEISSLSKKHVYECIHSDFLKLFIPNKIQITFDMFVLFL